MDSEENVDKHIPGEIGTIFILGSRTFSHEALAAALQRALSMKCILVSALGEMGREVLDAMTQQAIFLVDSQEMDLDTLVAEVSSFPALSRESTMIVLFNLFPDSGIERRAFMAGARGFFYREDSLDHMIKGLRALLDGHLWMSRDILVEFALLGSSRKESPSRERELLTIREKQVLALVSVGASNEEIAEKLFISPHTVKTHLYNTFKKISVPNRFQAALWAARNL